MSGPAPADGSVIGFEGMAVSPFIVPVAGAVGGGPFRGFGTATGEWS